MRPVTGLTLGPYRLLEPIGAGGMGVVWKARDVSLDRDVAIKFLPQGFTRDHERLARFRREAKAVAALSHPGIVAIHGFGEHDDAPYVVMELLEGRTLRDVLAAGPIAPERVLALARQAARALAVAHDRGILHRDLKPENLFVSTYDHLKILDFGLAAQFEPLHERDSAGTAVTRTNLTEPGTILGTTHYLSPEQLRGSAPDPRSDLFSFGAVIYEMLSGRSPFRRRTAAETFTAILHDDPGAPASAGPAWAGILRRCLAKNPAERFASARELVAALEAAAAPTRSSRRVALAAVVGVVLVALIGFAVRRVGVPGGTPPPGSTSIGEPVSGYPEANEYFEKGMMFMRTQLDMTRARAMLDRAIEIDPSHGSSRSMRALIDLIAIHEGFSNDPGVVYGAESALRRILSDHGNLASAHAALGAALLYINRKEQARAAFTAARRLNPMSQPGEIWSVLDDRLSDRLEQAAARARRLLEDTPLFWAARIILADVLLDQGHLDEARIEIDKVFEQDPNNLAAQRALARWLLYRGDVAEARRLLEQAGAADHENFRVRLVWALQLAREGRSADALDCLDRDVLKYAEIAMFAQAQIAEIYALASRPDDALDWLDRAVRAGDERSGWFRRDVLLDGIRDDPRFGAILDTIDRGKD